MVTDLEIKGGSSRDPLAQEDSGDWRQPAWGPGLSREWGQCPRGQQPASPCVVGRDPQCCSRKWVATLRSLLEALRASKASPLENPISMSRAT